MMDLALSLTHIHSNQNIVILKVLNHDQILSLKTPKFTTMVMDYTLVY